MDYIERIFVDDSAIVRRMNNKRERDLIVTDILEQNTLTTVSDAIQGPYSLNLSIINNKILLGVTGSGDASLNFELSLMPLRKIIKDYSVICSGYFEAVRNSDSRKIEGIDMGRRGAHNEGAEILQELLVNKLIIDFETSRKLFSLICLLQEK